MPAPLLLLRDGRGMFKRLFTGVKTLNALVTDKWNVFGEQDRHGIRMTLQWRKG